MSSTLGVCHRWLADDDGFNVLNRGRVIYFPSITVQHRRCASGRAALSGLKDVLKDVRLLATRHNSKRGSI